MKEMVPLVIGKVVQDGGTPTAQTPPGIYPPKDHTLGRTIWLP